MTRAEFMGISTMDGFYDWCLQNDYLELFDYYIRYDNLDDEIDNDISDYLRYHYWYDLRDLLDDISSGYAWYRKEETLVYTAVEDEDEVVCDLRDSIIDQLDDSYFDPEEVDEPEEDEDEELLSAQISVLPFLAACAS